MRACELGCCVLASNLLRRFHQLFYWCLLERRIIIEWKFLKSWKIRKFVNNLLISWNLINLENLEKSEKFKRISKSFKILKKSWKFRNIRQNSKTFLKNTKVQKLGKIVDNCTGKYFFRLFEIFRRLGDRANLMYNI